MNSRIRFALLGAVALISAAAATVGVANATLPYTEKDILQHAVSDQTYGTVLAGILDEPNALTYTIGAKVGTVRSVSFQAKRATRATSNVAVRSMFPCYLSDVSTGATITATASSSMALTTGGLVPLVTGKAYWRVTDASGVSTLAIGSTASRTMYEVCNLPNDQIAVSAALTY